MSKPTLSELLEQSKTMNTETPLMSEHDIRLMMAQADAGTAQPRLRPLPWIQSLPFSGKLAGLSAAAALAFIILYSGLDLGNSPTASTTQSPLSDRRNEILADEPMTFSSHNDTMKNADAQSFSDMTVSKQAQPKKMVANTISNDEEQSKQQSSMPDNDIALPGMLSLSAEQFKKLGITLTKDKLTYRENARLDVRKEAKKRGLDDETLVERLGGENILSLRQVTARTNGIGDIRITDSNNAAIAPLMITGYSNNKPVFSYYSPDDKVFHNSVRRLNEKADILMPSANGLVPVMATIENTDDPFFKKTTLVLWFEPTEQFLHALPEHYAAQLRKELQSPTIKPKTGEQFYTASYLEEDGAIIHSRVYPNPTPDYEVRFAFTLSQSRICTFTIVDMFGTLLDTAMDNQQFSQGDHGITLMLSSIEKSGMYMIIMHTDKGERIAQRLIVQR